MEVWLSNCMLAICYNLSGFCICPYTGGWNNARTVIRRTIRGQNMAVANTPDILSCDKLRPFWISWINGTIQVSFVLFPK